MKTHARALIIVPPFLNYMAGPLLGPAMLAGAARAAGHAADVLDLNLRYLQEHAPKPVSLQPSLFLGDHDKPGDSIKRAQRRFSRDLKALFPTSAAGLAREDPYLTLTYGHKEVEFAALCLLQGYNGRWLFSQLGAQPDPDLFGVSVLYSGQVVWGLAASLAARELWPSVSIVWGGPHITALQDAIRGDTGYAAVIDCFVIGQAERTIVKLLDGAAIGTLVDNASRQATILQGEEDTTVRPMFSDPERYGNPNLTLPAQCSRGCPYGRCRFCTYPSIESAFRQVPESVVQAVVEQAIELGAVVSFKDSILSPRLLRRLSGFISGRVRWSGCTRLNAALDRTLLQHLSQAGCRTLEIGVETMCPESQVLIDKPQSSALLGAVLDAATDSGLSLVINYITGFPGERPDDARRWLEWTRNELDRRVGLNARLEHNPFQLERLSRFGRHPEQYGIRVTAVWPWASVMGWTLA